MLTSHSGRMLLMNPGLKLLVVVFVLTALFAALPDAQAAAQLGTLGGTVTNDGVAVSDAEVVASAGSLVRRAATDAEGRFRIANLPPATYTVSVRPAGVSSSSPNWVFVDPPALVRMPPDADLNLKVAPATVTVVGSLIAPAGAEFVAPNRAWLRAEDQEGRGNSVEVAADGSFSLQTIPGPVLIRVTLENPAWDEDAAISGLVYRAEAGDTVHVDGNPQSEAIDPIAIVERSATISGTVNLLAGGTAPLGVPVRAWRLDGAEFTQTVTNAEGGYQLNLIPGVWMLRAVPLAQGNYVPAQSPQRVLVDEGQTASADLLIATADMTIAGLVVNADGGAAVPDLEARVFAIYRNADGIPTAGPAATVQADGTFTLKLASSLALTYTADLALNPDSGYSVADRPKPFNLTTPPDQLTIPVLTHDDRISGSLRDTEGEALLGVPGAIYAAGENGGWSRTRINPADGSYSLPVVGRNTDGEGGTTWYLRAAVDPSSGYLLQRPRSQRVFVPYAADSAVTIDGVDFQAVAIAELGQVRGRVLDSAGRPVAGVRVAAREFGVSDRSEGRWDYTNRRGEFTLRLPAGTYRLSANAGFGRPLAPRQIDPAPQTVNVAAGQNSRVELQMRSSDATLTGRVEYANGPQAALVRARANDGALVHVQSGADGLYRLPLLSGRQWQIEAVSSADDIFLRSAPATLTPAAGAQTGPTLELLAGDPLPESQLFAFDAAEAQRFVMGDNSEVQVPAGAFATEGTVVLTVRPLPELYTGEGVQPVSFGYRLHAYSADNNAEHRQISRFLRPVTISIPFSATQLYALGITPAQLVPAYWDEASASWKPVEQVTVLVDDAGNGTVQISTDHFTDYALLAASDTRIHLPFLTQ
ncbi:MAG: carboxypeptidase regulatory-like domain-containing protein [Oscillochloris sp.]|nr:carboxypeptidase regulatory-like domain-containing protein [Oscillochloris sp.]